ncbi:MAG: stage II sporulation protein R [Bacillota bacterium]
MRKKRKNDVFWSAILVLVAGILLFCGWGLAESRRAVKAYTPTNLSRVPGDLAPADTIRLHVIGNSDSSEDQDIKLAVRDVLMMSLGSQLSEAKDVALAERTISSCLAEIENVANSCLKDSGAKYGAKVLLKGVHFPDKTYETSEGKTVFLPEGEYKALQVVLGKGEGKNWWCVMYPPLCYFDLVQSALIMGKTHSSEQEGGVQAWTQTDGRFVLVDEESAQEVPIEIRFLIVDALKAGFSRLASFFKVEDQQAALYVYPHNLR